MSETHNDPTVDPANAGISARTDVGGQTGTEGAVQDNNVPVIDPRELASTGPTAPSATTTTQTETSGPKPGTVLGENAPKLSDLQNQLCPNCHTGVLYVTRYDPEALHEAGQGEALAKGKESGGGYEVRCFACEYSDSRAFNPGVRWGR